jgi:hypothetical protein
MIFNTEEVLHNKILLFIIKTENYFQNNKHYKDDQLISIDKKCDRFLYKIINKPIRDEDKNWFQIQQDLIYFKKICMKKLGGVLSKHFMKEDIEKINKKAKNDNNKIRI